MPKNVDDLMLQDGIEIPDDPLAIEAMLEAEEAGEAAKGKETPPPETKSGDEGKSGDDKGKQADRPVVPDQSKDKPGDEPTERMVPHSVLRRERENRHNTETLLDTRDQELAAERAKNAELEAAIAKGNVSQEKLQAAADRVTGDSRIKLETLDKAQLEVLRRDLDDASVDFLGKIVDQHNANRLVTERLQAEVAELRADKSQVEETSRQDDIDSIPLLAVIQATRSKDADLLWDRAVAYEKALQSDPDWADKSRSEIYTEIGSRLTAYLGADAAKWLADVDDAEPEKGKGKGSDRGKTVEDKLAAARTRATPDSLSDLPTGIAAAQHEQERLEAMSIHDLEELIGKAQDKGNLDEVLQRMSSAIR